MPWQVEDVMEKRIEFVSRSLEEGVNFSQLCRAYGISRRTGYKWRARYREVKSFVLLKEKSRRPHTTPTRIDASLEKKVKKERDEWGFGAKKIQWELAQKGIHLPVITINRILKRLNLVAPPSNQSTATKRFEREHPNELWQMDFKGEYPLKQGFYYPLSILDDCSRFLISLSGADNRKALTVQAALIRAFKDYGVPQGMLVDHGSPWWSTTNGHGLTWLSVFLIEQGIHLHYSGINHPQTQGKVERFHRTLKAAIAHRGQPQNLSQWKPLLKEFREMYNYKRPHEALGMTPPGEVYSPSSKAYDSHPPEWSYPSELGYDHINSQGFLTYERKRYFVCEALAHQRVGFEEADRKLLVRYRNWYVREIDLTTGRTLPLIESVTD